jgi:hypothetical protein
VVARHHGILRRLATAPCAAKLSIPLQNLSRIIGEAQVKNILSAFSLRVTSGEILLNRVLLNEITLRGLECTLRNTKEFVG